MAERIASGEIHIEVNERDAQASLERIERDYERTMRDIDRKKATVEINADIDSLKDDLKKAEAVVKDYDKRIAAAENKRSAAALRRQQNLRKAEADAAKQRLVEAQQRLTATKRENEELALTEKRVAAIEKREAARQRALVQAERQRIAAMRAEQRMMDQQERAKERIIRQEQRAAAIRAREEAAIPRMRRRYAELAGTIDKLNVARRRVRRDQRAKLIVDLKIDEAAAEMTRLKRVLEERGSPLNLEVDVHPGRDFGTRLRGAVDEGMRRGGGRQAAANAGVIVGMTFSDAVVRSVRQRLSPRAIAGGVGGIFSTMGRALGNLSNMTVRLGPFTATIRQAAFALALFAPILLDLVGATGAFIGLIGRATMGVGALSAGVIGGMVPAFIGFGFVIKSVASEFSNVMKAQKAYDDALRKGKTDLAAKKLKELKATMGNVSDETVKNIGLASKLGDRWRNMTQAGRGSVFTIIGDGLRTISDIMPMFARRTNQGLEVAQQGLSAWMKSLRSAEGQDILGGLMSGFNRSLRPALSGLGNLIAYLARVGNVALSFMPGILRTFSDWAGRLNDGARNTDALYKRVRTLVQAAKDLGNFFLAAGRLMSAFFGGGADEGARFANTMTDAMNRWTAFLKTTAGRQQLGDFFREAVDGAQAFYSFLAPIVSSFIQWAGLISPFARAFFEAAGAVGKFVAALLDATALSGPLTALAATLGTLWAISKIQAATVAIGNFTRALLGMQAAQGVAAAGGTAAAAAAGGTAAAGAKKAGDAADEAAKKSGRLKTALSALGGGLAGKVFNPWVVGAVAVGVGLSMVARRGHTAAGEFKKLSEASKDAAKSYETNTHLLADLRSNQIRANIEVRAARKAMKDTKAGTDERRLAELRLNDALREAGRANTRWSDSLRTQGKLASDAVMAEEKRLAKFREGNKSERERLELMNDHSSSAARRAKAQERLAILDEREARILATLERAQNRHAAAAAQQARAIAGLPPVAGRAEQALGRLARAGARAAASAIASKFADPADVERVSRSATRTIQSGVKPARVKVIVEGAKTAEEAIRRLQRVRIDSKKVEILTSGGKAAVRALEEIIGKRLPTKTSKIISQGGPEARRELERILGIKLPTKTQRIREQGGQAVNAALKVLRAFGIPTKTITIRANDQATPTLNALRQKASQAITQFINVVTRPTKKGKATGGGLGGGPEPRAATARAQDRAFARADRGTLARRSTGQLARGARISGPRAIFGEEPAHPEFVISTNPSYRDSNIRFLRQAAEAMGLDMSAPGRSARKKKKATHLHSTKNALKPGNKKKRLSEYGRKNVRKGARANLKGKTSEGYDATAVFAPIEAAKRAEDTQERDTRRAIGLLNEPDSFITQVGVDPNGDPIFDIDQGAIADWQRQLDAIARMFDTLAQRAQEVWNAADTAFKQLETTFNTANANTPKLWRMWQDADRASKRKGGSAAGRDAAKERAKVYKAAWEREVEIREGAKADMPRADDERYEAGFRKRDAMDSAAEYREDAAAIEGGARADAAARNPKPERPEPPAYDPAGPLGPSQDRVQALEGERDLADIGIGIGGKPPRSIADINADLKQANLDVIGIAQGMLADNDPLNDSAAWSAISGASGAVKALIPGDAAGASSASNQVMTYSTERGALYRGFGSNFGGGFGGFGSGGGAFGANSGGIVINNTFPTPPPDPHTWTRGIGFEIQSVV